MTSRIWYQLIDAITRGAFASTVPTSIRRTDDVEEFRETIKASDQAQSPSLFGNINPIQLHVFRTLEDLLNRRLLESSEAMTGLGETEAKALLVEVPPFFLTLEAKQLAWTSSENRSQLVITAETLVLELSAAFVNGSGIGKPRTLYCRRQMIAQCNEIFRCSIQTYALLWIVGPTGVGKSYTALAYAYSLEAASWDVIWLHLSRKTPSIACMWLRGNTKMTCTIRKKTLESQLTMLLGSTTHNKKTVVFLDGYVKSIKEEEIASDMCKEWRQNDEYNHRLVCICSMVGRGGDYRPELYETIPSVVDHSDVELYNLERKEETANDECLEAGNGDKLTEDDAKVDEEDTLDEVDEEDTFALESWRIEDYREAINSDSFWESVKDMFPLGHESDGATVEERMQLLEMKYCVAGGSARLMFGVSTEKAVKSLNIAIKEMPNIESFSREFLSASPSGVVHRLLALYRRYDDSGDHDICLVSDYVVRKIAVVLGPSLLKNFASMYRVNLAMDDHLFEAWVFSTLKYSGLKWFRKDFLRVCTRRWKRSEIVFFDPSRMTFGVSLTTPTWMAPVKWSLAGYDAVFVDASRGLVRFIQVTRAQHYNYDHIHFVEILDKLSLHDDLRGVRFRKVKLYFVVPREREAGFMLPVRAADFLTNIVQVASSSTLAGMKTRSHEETMFGGCMARVDWC